MYRAVPAGSVYYFEIIEGTQEQIVSLFNFKKISEERANEGFGFSLVGRVGND
jgi:CRISPR-associated protein Cmr3